MGGNQASLFLCRKGIQKLFQANRARIAGTPHPSAVICAGDWLISNGLLGAFELNSPASPYINPYILLIPCIPSSIISSSSLDISTTPSKHPNTTMSLLNFPNELILNVAENLPPKALNSLLRTSHRSAYLLTPLLHKIAIEPVGECPALCWAASNGHESLVKLLLKIGTPVEARDGKSMNALISAAWHGHEEIVRALLNAGANIASQEHYNGLTALHWAARAGHESMVRLLLEQGADVNRRDTLESYLVEPIDRNKARPQPAKHIMGRDNTPLHWAAHAGYNSVVRLLLKNGANLNDGNSLRDTPLIIAAGMASESTIRLLVDGGANLNAQNLRGWTALHYASRNELEKSVKLFLTEGANALLEDNGGLSPLRYTRCTTKKPVRKMLLQQFERINPVTSL